MSFWEGAPAAASADPSLLAGGRPCGGWDFRRDMPVSNRIKGVVQRRESMKQSKKIRRVAAVLAAVAVLLYHVASVR